ncbi:MAG: hypothetical protein ACI83W_002396 [Marinoscillum sp.]|jgi:hypothetical protein
MRDWQKVYQDSNEQRAEIVKAILEDMEMKPVLLNKKDSAYQFGAFEVLVRPDFVLRALKVINDDIKFE